MLKVQNTKLNMKDFQHKTTQSSPAQKRYLNESEGNMTSTRAPKHLNYNSETIGDSYALPSRDSFLGVNMKFQRKKHPVPEEYEDSNMFIREEPEYSVRKMERSTNLMMAREKFFKRKAEYIIKKNLRQTSKKLSLIKF